MGLLGHDERARRRSVATGDERDLGRHFADDVLNQMLTGNSVEQAIHAAVDRWMNWTIGRVTSRDYGIPRGMPYLTGFVIHCGISEEIAA